MSPELLGQNPKNHFNRMSSIVTAGGADHPAAAVAVEGIPAGVLGVG